MGVLDDFSPWLVKTLILLSSVLWDGNNSHSKLFGSFFLGFLASCPVQLQNSANVFKDQPNAGLSFLLLGILAIHVSNFCLSIFKRLPSFLLVFLPLNSDSAEALCLDLQPLNPSPSFGKCPKGKSGCRILVCLSVVLSFPGFPPSISGYLKNSIRPLSRCVSVCICALSSFSGCFHEKHWSEASDNHIKARS